MEQAMALNSFSTVAFSSAAASCAPDPVTRIPRMFSAGSAAFNSPSKFFTA
jgi:hypothetical protein